MNSKHLTVLAATLLMLGAGTASATGVTGTVYCDANQNRMIDGMDSTLASVNVIVESPATGTFSDLTNFVGIYFMDLPNVTPVTYEQSLEAATLPDGGVIVGPATQTFDITVANPAAVVDWLVDAPVCREPFCGDGDLDEGEQCDDGNNEDGDGCSAECTDEVADGCTPGYWKQEQHFDSYPAGVGPDTLFSAIFEDAFPGKTLLDVMQDGGGGLMALGRHAVAAYLNASTIDYGLTSDQVVDAFNAVFPGSRSSYIGLKNDFEMLNELGCPLD
jgi:cysteine-rich repeat protein